MAKRIILGAELTNRIAAASKFQETISAYGCNIKTRIGLHNVGDNYCSGGGLILLEMFGDENTINEMEQKIRNIEGVEVQKMVFQE